MTQRPAVAEGGGRSQTCIMYILGVGSGLRSDMIPIVQYSARH